MSFHCKLHLSTIHIAGKSCPSHGQHLEIHCWNLLFVSAKLEDGIPGIQYSQWNGLLRFASLPTYKWHVVGHTEGSTTFVAFCHPFILFCCYYFRVHVVFASSFSCLVDLIFATTTLGPLSAPSKGCQLGVHHAIWRKEHRIKISITTPRF